MNLTQIKRILIGDPIETEMAHHQSIPKWKALAVLSSDALSSVAYATEEVLLPLAAFASAAVAWSIPIALAIAFLLIVVTISYRQTIDSYPGGGGAYTVAKENLGTNAGLVAGAALLIDYVLTVSVSVSAGVENISSAFPQLAPHNELLGVMLILIIMLFNLRGVKESASVFALPTYLFIGSFLLLIGVGAYRLATGDLHQIAPIMHESYPEIPVFLLLRAFSSGCSALTGIEAISNGIPIFKPDQQRNAKITMAWMSFILGFLFLSITLLSHVIGIVPHEGETAVSLLASAVFGKTWLYFLVQASTALILLLAANTSYADFPRLSSLLAKDGFLPRQLASLGDRLVFSNGIMGLSFASIVLIVLFRGETHLLIPLYAVGVFMSFTLSQTGMIIHHLRTKHPGYIRSMFFNCLGALTTLLVLIVISITKFTHGAWMVIVLIPLLVILFKQIRTHYVFTAKKLAHETDSDVRPISGSKHIAIVPVSGLHPGVTDSLRYGLSIAQDVRACFVDLNPEATQRLKHSWKRHELAVQLVVLKSPYRSVIRPILDYVDLVAKENRGERITVIIPEFVTVRWYHNFLHNQTAILLYAALRGRSNVVVTSVRHYLAE